MCLAEFHVKDLTTLIHGIYRNITMDNWFTLVSLADQLLQDPYKLTMIETIRKNKKVPKRSWMEKVEIQQLQCFALIRKNIVILHAKRKTN